MGLQITDDVINDKCVSSALLPKTEKPQNGTEVEESSQTKDEALRATTGPIILEVQETARSWLMLAVAFLFQALYGFAAFVPPVLLVVYMDYFQTSSSIAAWIGSVYLFCCFLIGLVASTCVTHFGCRKTAMFGSLVLSISIGISSLAPNIAFIYVFQSVFAGFGAGSAFVSVNVMLPKHFGKHRALASSFALSGMGLGMIAAPALLNYWLSQYEWRGAVLLEAATLAHMVPLAMTFSEPKVPQNPMVKTVIDLSTGDNPDVPAPVQRTATKDNEEDEEESKQPVSFLLSSCHKFLKTTFDFSVLRDKLFLLYCISNFLCRVNSSTIITHLPNFIITRGYTLDHSAFVTSLAGGFCIAARFTASLLASNPKLNHLATYSAAMILNSWSSAILLIVPGTVGQYIGVAFFGIGFGFDYPFVPVILVQMMGMDHLARSFAVYNLLSLATVILIIPPFVGLLFDITGSYNIPFSLGTGLGVLGVGLSFIAAYFLTKRRHVQAEKSTKEKC